MKKNLWVCVAGFVCLFLNMGRLPAADTFKPDKNGFICDWLIGGPFPSYWVNNNAQGYSDDFLSDLGGEAAARPYAGLASQADFIADKSKLIAGIGSTNEWGYKETKTLPVKWRELHWDKPKPTIVLDKMFLPVDDHIACYAFCYVQSPEDRAIKVRIGSDDDHKVWLNGKYLGGVSKSQGVVPDNYIYKADLKRGLNRLMFKVVDRTHGYGFCLALSDINDKPLQDIRIRLEHPGKKLLKQVAGLQAVDAWDNGFYASMKFPAENVFVGKNKLNVQVGVPESGEYRVGFNLKCEGKTISQSEKTVKIAKGKLLQWAVDSELPVGKVSVALDIFGGGDAQLAKLTKSITVLDPVVLEKENDSLEAQITTIDADMAKAEKASDDLGQDVEDLKQQREMLYGQIEAAYLQKRGELRSTPKAVVDEPVQSARVTRKKICLNGDMWKAALGAKTKDGDVVYAPPAAGKWRDASLPMTQYNKYFRTWRFPVRNIPNDNGKTSPYGKVESLPGWPDYTFNEMTCSSRTWFRKEIELTQKEAEAACSFVCENANGRLHVFLNGELCGEYTGNVGFVSIPLKGMKPGSNMLELYMESSGVAGLGGVQKRFSASSGWGIRGDVYFDIAAPVMVGSATVKTSWRKGEISVATEIENRGRNISKVRLAQYCVLDGRVKYKFEPVTVELSAQSKSSVENKGLWLEAKPWGIGGKYGDPVMYDLVSDIYVGGKLVDRRIEPFGFREFWIAGTDFYLNGKRIILQGDVGLGKINRKRMEVILPLLRADGINTIRIHDSEYWSADFFRVCDRMGMLVYAQMYPIIHEKSQPGNFNSGKREYVSYDDWLKHPLHEYNLRNYANWVKMLQNHPSVVMAATDNEIFTQAWDRPEVQDYNIRNDRLGAFYGRYVKSLMPSLIITRDGDEGTWGHKGKWHEDPPCDTANYHYPDFNVKDWVLNWQSVYDFRPAVFGETLYCSYGAWDKWIGAIPSQVQKKANKVREIASLYREQGIPGQIYMGLSSDGFIMVDDTGNGNPWKITAAMHKEYKEKKILACAPRYPWGLVEWPSQSGTSEKVMATSINIGAYGHKVINWFDGKLPSHVRNAVNDAYRDSLLPMPLLAAPAGGECIVQMGEQGSGKVLTAVATDGLSEAYAVTADKQGKAWLQLPRPGKYTLECDGKSVRVEVPGRADYACEPGFDRIKHINFK